MAIFNAGMLIAYLRKSANLTQEQLAEGICARESIGKIERGERKPDWFTFRNIMHRLGQDPELYFNDYADKDEIYVLEKFKQCEVYVNAFNHKKLKRELDMLEKHPLFAPRTNKRNSLGYLVFLRLKANLHAQGEYKDLSLAMKCTLDCLRHRRPDFEIDKINEYFLSHDEFLLVNNLAIISRELEGLPAALDIWLKLKENHDRNYSLNPKDDNAYRVLVMNIAIALKLSKRYEECLKIATEGYDKSLAHNDLKSFSRFLYQRAFCLMKLGQKEEGKALYKKFLMFAYVMDGYANICFKTVMKEYEDEFGEASPSGSFERA